jgi:hypothetical protein
MLLLHYDALDQGGQKRLNDVALSESVRMTSPELCPDRFMTAPLKDWNLPDEWVAPV